MSVVNDLVASTKNEPDARNYEWFASGDKKKIHLYERYTDSAAALAHLETFNEKFAQRLLATVDPARMVVYGDPTSEARKVLDGFGAIYMAQIGGFAR
jgi:quinol monooxygenase YgiN